MLSYLLILCVIFTTPSAHTASAASGSVELDEISFNKIIKKFDAALVKFDVAFPYGDKHEAFVALAKDSKDIDELLIAEVGVKDYGEKDNEALAKKYGASKDNFPVVKLFVKGKSEPIPFDESQDFTSDELRRFVRVNTGIYLSLPGCIRELDNFATKFMKTKDDERKNVLKDAEAAIQKLGSKDANSGKIYKTIMDKVMEKGDDFVKTEYARVNKLLSGKVSEEKKKLLHIRINILQSFQLFDKKVKPTKQEL